MNMLYHKEFKILQQRVKYVWHKNLEYTQFKNKDCIVTPKHETKLCFGVSRYPDLSHTKMANSLQKDCSKHQKQI